MTAVPLETPAARIHRADLELLRALAARARHPRHPAPAWTGGDPRLPPPPLAEILYELSPAGDTTEPAAVEAANLHVVAALVARQRLAAALADETETRFREDVIAALDAGDRERLLALLCDLPAELRELDTIREAAARETPELPPDLVAFLWREHLIPWTRQSALAHLLEP